VEDLVGSLEAGKRADCVVLDTDLLTCPAEAIGRTRVLQTYLGGKLVFSGPPRKRISAHLESCYAAHG